MIIRQEKPADRERIHALNEAAFETSAEADLVDALREKASTYFSLVAVVDDEIVGHIVFTPVTLGDCPDCTLFGLGPMAVLPGLQKRGIGSALALAGIELCRQAGVGALVVLGHPGYYPRFGFIPASIYSIGSEYKVHDDAFMATELEMGCLDGCIGIVRYHEAFNEAMM